VGHSALRILIVDDHEDTAEMLSMLLEGKGHATQVALDGTAALISAASFQPHLGLLDLSLPGMSGYELAERLRAIPGLTRIRLVALLSSRRMRREDRSLSRRRCWRW